MRKILPTGIIVLAIALGVAACKLEDVLNFGAKVEGAIEHLLELEEMYCAEQAPEIREKLLKAIRTIKADYPEEGFCGVVDSVDDFLNARKE